MWLIGLPYTIGISNVIFGLLIYYLALVRFYLIFPLVRHNYTTFITVNLSTLSATFTFDIFDGFHPFWLELFTENGVKHSAHVSFFEEIIILPSTPSHGRECAGSSLPLIILNVGSKLPDAFPHSISVQKYSSEEDKDYITFIHTSLSICSTADSLEIN